MTKQSTLIRGVVRSADLGATFVFAAEGALAGVAAGLDPVGLLVVAFLTGLGGGLLRDLLLASGRPAAVSDGHYSFVVIAAALTAWFLHAALRQGRCRWWWRWTRPVWRWRRWRARKRRWNTASMPSPRSSSAR
jgi:uncharacterized membrane protein YeiH